MLSWLRIFSKISRPSRVRSARCPLDLQVEVLGLLVATESHATVLPEGPVNSDGSTATLTLRHQLIIPGRMGRLEAAGHSIITATKIAQDRGGRREVTDEVQVFVPQDLIQHQSPGDFGVEHLLEVIDRLIEDTPWLWTPAAWMTP